MILTNATVNVAAVKKSQRKNNKNTKPLPFYLKGSFFKRLDKMTEIKPKLEYTVTESQAQTPVIVVAGGNSTRMGGVNKQFLSICSIPVIIRTLRAFEFCDCISRIILVTREEDIAELQLLTEKYGIKKLSDIVCGGNTRQQSVKNGLERLSPDEEAVIIHDGARPLIEEKIIRSVTDALKDHIAVTCAVKIKDTIKQVNEDGKVIKTLPRDSLVAVQTPQGVRVAEYRRAITKAGDISTYTDDTSILEAAGYEVYTVDGSYKNIKITTPEDIVVAKNYISNA